MKHPIVLFLAALPVLCSGMYIGAPKKPVAAKKSTIKFSGYTWQVRESGDNKLGPGPNLWKGGNVFVDAKGYLHLKLTKVGNNWYSAEVTSDKSFGYGTYQWQVEGRIDTLDKNVVLGLFNYSGVDGNDEMDIEISRWGKATTNNTSYTMYPAQPLPPKAEWNRTFNTVLTDGENTTQRFTRNGDKSVFFQELSGFHNDNTGLIDSVTCTSPPNSISALAMPVHMNLWLFDAPSPSNNAEVEIIIHSFKFTPQ
jgi:hypothetical protein